MTSERPQLDLHAGDDPGGCARAVRAVAADGDVVDEAAEVGHRAGGRAERGAVHVERVDRGLG